MSYLRFYPILLISLATVVLAACGSPTRPSAQSEESASESETVGLDGALASVCYYFEMATYANKGMAQDLLGREITSAETAQFARLHERDYMEKYPPPVSFEQMEVDLFTYCDFNALTDEQQAIILRAAKEVGGLRGGMTGSR